MTRTPRGIRNNNPGNIRHGENWQGMAPQQTDTDFIQFISPQYGIRAMARILATYRDRYGLTTVAQIIDRWAPPTENNTTAYVQDVAELIDVTPDHQLTGDDLPYLLAAIIYHENGEQPYSMEIINQGVALA